MSRILEEHSGYLADAPRMTAFRAAIVQVVRPGDVVVDIGTGTGVMALLACAAGAARVYAIEHGGIVELARKIARANGYHDRIHFLRAESSRAVIPEPVDVVVSDLIGPFAFDAGVFEVLVDARARYLKPRGRTIPSEVTLYAAPVECEPLGTFLKSWRERPAGFDMSAAYDHARKSVYHARVEAADLLGDSILVGRFPQPLAESPRIKANATVTARRDGVIDALAGWFDATLAPGVHITNAPGAPDRLARRDVLLPVAEPIRVSAGDTIDIGMTVLTSDHVYRWTVARRDAAGRVTTFSGSTFEGLLISREDLPSPVTSAEPS